MARNGASTPAQTVREGLNDLDDKRIKNIRPLIPPQILMEDYPLTLKAAVTVLEGRKAAEAILAGDDDRLLVPRTTVGWKGLINDPQLNGSFQINKGLRLARGLLLEIATLGLPTGCEFLDTISPQYTADLVSWGAIGARTTESQIHRELASGMSMPVGFKNGTDGSLQIAIDAIGSAGASHSFLSVTKQGISAIVETDGNPSCHVILRGSNTGPNYSAEHVASTAAALEKAKLAPRIMIDCSHGNSEKKHERQLLVASSISAQLKSPSTSSNIIGVMIESNLVAGKQSIPASGPQGLVYGQSVTDACLDWENTRKALEELREGVRARRAAGVMGTKGTRELNGVKESEGHVKENEGDFNDVSAFPSA